jgi:argininosuccinate synthase
MTYGEGVGSPMKTVLLWHTGGPETLAAIPGLADRYGAGVVSVTVDVGQDGTSAAWRERARSAGAIRAHVLDARDEFARDYVLRALHAGALGRDVAGEGPALHRALLADKLVDLAAMEGASVVAHGFEPHGDEALELERLIGNRRPDLVVVAAGPLSAPNDPDLLPQPAATVLSVDSTLWWRRAVLGLPERSPVPRSIPGVRQGFFTVVPAERCPTSPASIEITFEHGVPASLNGIEMPLVELIEAIDTIAGDHGVGRTVVEASGLGTRHVIVIEAPAARVLVSSFAALARAIESPSLWRLHRQLGKQYAKLLQSGGWHSDARGALDAFALAARRWLSGAVRLELRRGRCRVIEKTRAEYTQPRHVPAAQSTPEPPARFTVPLPH